jgi:hypothetical protein
MGSVSTTVRELPKISIEFRITEKGLPDITYTYEGDMAEQMADQYQQIVGNGLARVSVGVPMGLKDYGNGAESSVHISLTCNQDAQTIHAAVQLATAAALHYGKENLVKALTEFDQIRTQRQAEQQGMLPPGNGPQYR